MLKLGEVYRWCRCRSTDRLQAGMPPASSNHPLSLPPARITTRLNYALFVIFLDDSEGLRLQRVLANSSENVSGLESNLTPRKGQSADNPWQRHGSTPPKEPRPVRAPSPFRSIPNSASSWGALTGLTVYHRPNPWRCHGLRVACPFGAKRLRLK
jgi:hypothetical protein